MVFNLIIQDRPWHEFRPSDTLGPGVDINLQVSEEDLQPKQRLPQKYMYSLIDTHWGCTDSQQNANLSATPVPVTPKTLRASFWVKAKCLNYHSVPASTSNIRFVLRFGTLAQTPQHTNLWNSGSDVQHESGAHSRQTSCFANGTINGT